MSLMCAVSPDACAAGSGHDDTGHVAFVALSAQHHGPHGFRCVLRHALHGEESESGE